MRHDLEPPTSSSRRWTPPDLHKPRHNFLTASGDSSRPCRGRRGPPPGVLIDTPPQPLYTRADGPVRTVAVSERRSL
jgi:hypothetical protein